MSYKGLYAISAVVVLLFGCNKDKSFCSTPKPLKQLDWLKVYLKDGVHCKIYNATYDGIDGFLIYTCLNDDCSLKLGEFKTCKNETICRFGIIDPTCLDFDSKKTYSELIYSY